MVFKFPRVHVGKRLASATYEFIMPITLSETNVERLLISVFERVIRQGTISQPKRDSSSTADQYDAERAKLSEGPWLTGFESKEGDYILDGWLRSSVLSFAQRGKDRNSGERVEFVKPLSVASYRGGLPINRGRHRKADRLIYGSMAKYWCETLNQSRETLKDLLLHSELGKSTELGHYPYSAPRYKSGSDVDLTTLLEFRFLETLEPRDPLPERQSADAADPTDWAPVPHAPDRIGKNLVHFLGAFGGGAPLEVGSGLTCLVALDLYQYPIRVARFLEAMFEQLDVADLMGEGIQHPQMFVDFTQDPKSSAANLSRLCVQRDLQLQAQLFAQMVLLRETEVCIRAIREKREHFEKLTQPEKLFFLLESSRDDQVKNQAGLTLQLLETLLLETKDEEMMMAFNEIVSNEPDDLMALRQLVLEDRRKIAHEGIRRWGQSTGGFSSSGAKKPYAFLSGSMRAPSTWRYELSELQVTTLVDMCFVGENGRLQNARTLPMSALLTRLEDRFGILVDRPPTGMDSPEAFQAAAHNYSSFTRTLKSLGYFEGLSDDFSAQDVVRRGN